MHTQYSICWRWNVANEQAEAKRYVEENITILYMIISSSHSYVYLFQVLHNSRFFLLLNALYTNKARFFRARSFCVAKSNANWKSHGLLKYLGSINAYLKSSNAGQHRTKWTWLSRDSVVAQSSSFVASWTKSERADYAVLSRDSVVAQSSSFVASWTKSERADYAVLSRDSVVAYQGNQLAHNSLGNDHPSSLACSLTVYSGICTHELISTKAKQKLYWEWSSSLPPYCLYVRIRPQTAQIWDSCRNSKCKFCRCTA